MADGVPGGGTGGRVGWVVGRYDWLNSDESLVSRYWRMIEDGSEASNWPWVGRRLVGLWGPDAGPYRSPGTPGNLITGVLSAAGQGNGQKFVPFFPRIDSSDAELRIAAQRALRYYLRGGQNIDMLYGSTEKAKKRMYYYLTQKAPLDKIPFVSSMVQRPIIGAHHYRDALASYDPMAVEIAQMREVFQGSLGGAEPGSRAGVHNLRADVAAQTQDNVLRSGRRKREGGPVGGGNIWDGLYIGASSSILTDAFRDNKGRFATFQSEVRAVNARVAKGFQDAVVAQMAENRKRPASNALRRATADRRNRYPEDV